MAFGLNRAEVIGRLGADVTVNHLTSGGRVANLSIATDESYIDRQSGDRVDRTEWHRVVTFQPGLVDMFEKHARKGRLVYVAGKLQTLRWTKDDEDSVGCDRDPAGARQEVQMSWTSRMGAQAATEQAMPLNGAADSKTTDIPF